MSVGGIGPSHIPAQPEPDFEPLPEGWDTEPRLGGDFANDADLQAVFRGDREVGLGDRSDAVKLVQQELYRAGISVRGGFDGVFGRGTEAAVAGFQRSVGLPASGRVDRDTLLKLQEAPWKRLLPAAEPLTRRADSYLHTQEEREAYAFCERKVWTGSSWSRGIDLAVTDDDTKAVLDRLDTLSPSSYGRVLHALAATRTDSPKTPTALDKLIRRGTSQTFNVRLSERFCQQLTDKLGTEPEPERRILRHISPDSVDRLKGWASWANLLNLFG
ncbi:peptidoglycan-binding protein [Planctomycetota bacterium]